MIQLQKISDLWPFQEHSVSQNCGPSATGSSAHRREFLGSWGWFVYCFAYNRPDGSLAGDTSSWGLQHLLFLAPYVCPRISSDALLLCHFLAVSASGKSTPGFSSLDILEHDQFPPQNPTPNQTGGADIPLNAPPIDHHF